VRYISHELRTPMNAATLGLQLIMERLQDKSNQRSMRDEETLEVFQDVQLACYTAVDILNDLLSFEKLDSGILELHKTEVSPIDFINDCIKLFASQARQHDVVLESSLEDVNGFASDAADAYPLIASDIVMMDKFKMDQVLRNLVSNALKFSPSGEVVTLTAAYITYKRDMSVSTKETSTSVKSQSRRFSIRTPRLITPRRKLSAIYSSGGDNASTMQSSEKPGGHNQGDHWLQIRVTDHGAGISPENQKKLFKEVVQFNPEKLQAGGGSGFGLFISKGIVDLHSGRISAFSEGDGKGCTFTVEIPMVPRRPDLVPDNNSSKTEPTERALFTTTQEESEQLPDKLSPPQESFTLDYRLVPSENPKSPLSPKASGGGGSASPHRSGDSKVYRLLVVDDSRMSRKMLNKFLSSAGHTCEEAEDGRQCLEMVKACEVGEGFDAILMDFIMPYMDGPTATRELRAMGYTGIILGVTGNGLQSDITYFKSCGANHVLVKPFQIEEFSKIMDGL
jgi:signal transduction histidine kinase